MDRLFLDANVLFSAAHREGAGFAEFWKLNDAVLLSSASAVEEARVNLREDSQRSRHVAVVSGIQVNRSNLAGLLPDGVDLPEKDRPILLSAIEGRATHIITCDKDDFGRYLGGLYPAF